MSSAWEHRAAARVFPAYEQGVIAMRKFFALLVLALAMPALAWSQMTPVPVPAPARGTTGNQCFEDCMQHYRGYDNMVEGSTAAQCANGCGYRPNAAPPKENASCQQRCAAQYNDCMAHSPDPTNDRNCPVNNLQCQQSCF